MRCRVGNGRPVGDTGVRHPHRRFVRIRFQLSVLLRADRLCELVFWFSIGRASLCLLHERCVRLFAHTARIGIGGSRRLQRHHKTLKVYRFSSRATQAVREVVISGPASRWRRNRLR